MFRRRGLKVMGFSLFGVFGGLAFLAYLASFAHGDPHMLAVRLETLKRQLRVASMFLVAAYIAWIFWHRAKRNKRKDR